MNFNVTHFYSNTTLIIYSLHYEIWSMLENDGFAFALLVNGFANVSARNGSSCLKLSCSTQTVDSELGNSDHFACATFAIKL